MKIIQFNAENVKRLKVVDFTPDDTIQFVTGDNSQGKSSVLDAIWLALGGGDASKSVKSPVRNGEDHASVTLNLGKDGESEYIITREWKDGRSTLTVKAANGAKFASPQALLDSLLGTLAFDPLAFIRLEPKKQLEALTSIVKLDLNLEAHAIERENAYNARTEINRKVKERKAQLDALGMLEDAPAEPVNFQEILSEIESQYNFRDAFNNHVGRVTNLEQEIDDLRKSLERKLAELALALENPPAPFDPAILEGLQTQLAEVEVTNDKVRRNNERREIRVQYDAAVVLVENLTQGIEDLDRAKTEALANAQFPVPGLGFTEDGVTFNGLPLSDASDSEKIKVSLAMAMALNPKIRVIRIMDGSLLDSKNLAIITEMAKEQDFQLWVESVGDSGVGIVMEDGEVVKDYSK